MSFLYNQDNLQHEMMNPISSEFVNILKLHGVNPDTIKEIAVIDNLSIIKISNRLYSTYALSSGYSGGGPAALFELLKWCSCNNSKIYDIIGREKRVHFNRAEKKLAG